MKKVIFIVGLILLVTFAPAQKLYFGFGGGYAKGLKTNAYVPISQYTSSYSSWPAYVNHRAAFSLAQGVQVNVYTGYDVKSFLGLEVNLSYLHGRPYEYSSGTYYNAAGEIKPRTTQHISMQANMLRLMPTIRLSLKRKSISSYIKAGLIMGFPTRCVKHEETGGLVEVSPPPQSTMAFEVLKLEWEYKGGISYGLYGAVGINYALNQRLRIYLEGAAIFQYCAVKKGVISQINGSKNVDGQLP